MLIKAKKIMVMGIGITGISALKLLNKYDNELTVYDEKPEDQIIHILEENKLHDIKIINNDMVYMIQGLDFIVKSPGIPPDNKVIMFAQEKEIPVISDIELAYNMGIQGTIIGITGTNGKTTSTVLTGEILRNQGSKTYVAGNVGIGIFQVLEDIQKDEYLVLELSSFQLEYTYLFRPRVSLILNITEDHLDWHGSFDSYMASKFKIFANQSGDDFLVLNWDDENLRKAKDRTRASIIWFSSKEKLPEGVYKEDGWIVYRIGGKVEKVLPLEDILIPGDHNIENICGVIGIMKALHVHNDTIRKTVNAFRGVEHRIEFVAEINGVSYYNDSKGTNVESTVKAIDSFNNPITLIAGGYDKGADYGRLLKVFKKKARALILMGSTAEAIKNAAEKIGMDNIKIVENMEEAVQLAASFSNAGDIVLLSPACASWDMYKNYEERGDHFKRIVNIMAE
ncbi:MAG: UDP-N-acetylmuramoyl-L-alanine--D-glutamate ligase [Bacillota bacterium]